jgi:hypothetical protein
MPESAKLSLDAIRRIQGTQARARDDLERALSSEWHQLGNLTSEERQLAGRQSVIRLLGAYASKFFDLEASEYAALKLEPSELIRHLDELAVRVQTHVVPPQFRINSSFYLGDLHYDDAYRSHILSALKDRVADWKKGLARESEAVSSPREILEGYRRREKITIAELAKRARVDESVIYALKAGRKDKCGSYALGRIASLVGCEPGQLLPDD